jgi:hypothetical protein
MGIGMMNRLYHDPQTPLMFEVREFENVDHGQHLKDKPQSHSMDAGTFNFQYG